MASILRMSIIAESTNSEQPPRPTITVIVGNEDYQKEFTVDQTIACCRSEYFKTCVQRGQKLFEFPSYAVATFSWYLDCLFDKPLRSNEGAGSFRALSQLYHLCQFLEDKRSTQKVALLYIDVAKRSDHVPDMNSVTKIVRNASYPVTEDPLCKFFAQALAEAADKAIISETVLFINRGFAQMLVGHLIDKVHEQKMEVAMIATKKVDGEDYQAIKIEEVNSRSAGEVGLNIAAEVDRKGEAQFEVLENDQVKKSAVGKQVARKEEANDDNDSEHTKKKPRRSYSF